MATGNEINEAIARWRGWWKWEETDEWYLENRTTSHRLPDCLHDAEACLEALQYVMRQDELYAGCPDAPIALDLSARSDGAYWCGLPIYTDAYNIKTVEGRGATLTEAIARAIYAAITEGQG